MSRRRHGFTAIELLVVMMIISVIAGMTLPRVMDLMARNAVKNGAHAIQQVWLQAQNLAQQNTMPPGSTPKHYGVWLRQGVSGRVEVSLIHAATAAPDHDDELRIGSGQSRTRMNRNVILTSVAAGGTSRDGGAQTHVWYAQYGTGMPVPASAVAAGTAPASAPVAMGITANGLPGISAVDNLRIQNIDFEADGSGSGIAFDFKLFPVGVASVEEVGR